jgi:hypothetical protein
MVKCIFEIKFPSLLILAHSHEEKLFGSGHGQIYAIHEFEHSRSHRHRGPHDDTLADPFNGILFTLDSRFKQMVRGLFKGGQHQHGIFHLGNPVPCDPKNLSLEGHDIAK